METAGLARPDVERGGPSPLAPWQAVADLLGWGGGDGTDGCERRRPFQGAPGVAAKIMHPPFPPPASPLSLILLAGLV